MILKNKKIACLGDSITAGNSTDKTFNYVYYLQELSNAEVINYGVCATRIATRLVPHEIDFWNDSFLERSKRMTEKYDVILVFGGTNDYAKQNPTPLGDINSSDEHSFYGALKILYNYLIVSHPESQIFIVTPLHREKEKNYGLEGLELLDYVNAEKEVASWYSLPVIDLWNTSGIQAQNLEVMKEFLVDGLHPTQKGARRIAERIYSFLKSF